MYLQSQEERLYNSKENKQELKEVRQLIMGLQELA